MFHTPNLDLTRLAARSMGLPLMEIAVSGEPEREVEELEAGLGPLAQAGKIDGLLAGAIASDYQWTRLNEIGHRLGLPCLTPLWRVDPVMVLRDEISSGLKFMIVAAQTGGLDERWLGHIVDVRADGEPVYLWSYLHAYDPVSGGCDVPAAEAA